MDANIRGAGKITNEVFQSVLREQLADFQFVTAQHVSSRFSRNYHPSLTRFARRGPGAEDHRRMRRQSTRNRCYAGSRYQFTSSPSEIKPSFAEVGTYSIRCMGNKHIRTGRRNLIMLLSGYTWPSAMELLSEQKKENRSFGIFSRQNCDRKRPFYVSASLPRKYVVPLCSSEYDEMEPVMCGDSQGIIKWRFYAPRSTVRWPLIGLNCRIASFSGSYSRGKQCFPARRTILLACALR